MIFISQNTDNQSLHNSLLERLHNNEEKKVA
jgi:hypothetical protein